MTHPRVVHCKRSSFDVYVGRPSVWGNPFTVEEHGRGEALRLYIEWLYQPQQLELRNRARKELRGKTLACWCAPRACHADWLVTVSEEEFE